MTIGRQAICGHTWPPWTAAASSRPPAPGLALSAVQVTGRPVRTDSSAISCASKSGPRAMAKIPRLRLASGSASAKSSSEVASRLGTGLP
jgi:hypothetical protein